MPSLRGVRVKTGRALIVTGFLTALAAVLARPPMAQAASPAPTVSDPAAAAQPASPATEPPATTPVPTAPTVLSFVRRVLPNGVTLLVRPNFASNVVGIEMISRVGTRYELDGKAGLTSLTLRTAEAGTTDESGSAILQWFEDRGSALDTRVHPDYVETGAAIMAPYFPTAARILGDIAGHATLSLQGFASQKKVLLAEITSADGDEEARSYQSLRTLLAGGTAYGRGDNGVAATVSSLTLDDVARYYHLVFAPRQIIVAVSGHIDADRAFAILEPIFGELRDTGLTASPAQIHTFVQEPPSMVTAGSGDAAWIMVGFLTPGVRQKDYAAAYVLNAIIGGANSGLLTTLFRDRKGVYDSGSFLQPFASQTHIVGYVRADPLLWDQEQQKMRPTVNDLQADLLGVFASVRDHGVTPEQVAFAREYVIGEYLRSHEHNKDFAGYLGWYEAIGLGAGFDEQFVKEIRKVTPEQINELSRTYLRAPLAATVVAFPRPSAAP